MGPKRRLPLLAVIGLLTPPVLGLLYPRTPPQPRRADEEEPTLTKVYVNLPYLPLNIMTNVATDVIRGHITDMQTVFPETGIGYTDVGLDVTWALKGTSEDHLAIRTPGAADIMHPTIVDQAPRLAVGDDVMMFIHYDEATGALSLLGLNQGVYHVTTTDDGQEVVLGKEANGLLLSDFIDALGNN